MSALSDVQCQSILLIDDTPANLGVMVDQLEDQGFRVFVAQDGEEGLKRACLTLPDLILLDVMMPGLDGLETCRRLKEIESTRNIPVIFMTALTDTADKVEGFKAGGVDYVSKPFQVEELLARVNAHLSLHAMQKRIAAQNAQLQLEVGLRQQAEDDLQCAYAALEASETRYRALVEQSPDAILIERDGCIVFANEAATRLFHAQRPADLLGHTLLTFVAPSGRAAAAQAIDDLISGGTPHTVEEQALRLDGSSVAVAVTRIAFGYQGSPAIQVVARDISESQRMQSQLKHLATHDALTGLPNRTLLMDRLSQTLAYAKRNSIRFMVAFIDLDRFKWVNDNLGHEAGDQLLQTVSRRLSDTLRESDTVARIGGDEFVALMSGADSLDDGFRTINRIVERVSQPITFDDGREISVSCSVGCSTFPEDGAAAEELLGAADAALYQAKQTGRNNLQVFNAELRRRIAGRITLESALRHALERDEFALHYQPQVDLHSGAIVGVEALLRWQHPDYSNLSPTHFIVVAEENGLIAPIGEWVLQQACRQSKAWQDSGLPAIRMAVNLSAKQLHRPGLTALVAQCLASSGLDPAYLELELTESASMDDPDKIIPLLQQFKELGAALVIDDFGTGYSNLRYLTRLPVDKLKLDGSFIREITTDPGQLAIASAVVVLAHRLGLKVVAEMTETEGQVVLLDSLGCDQAQGHFFGAALPGEACAGLLETARLPLPATMGRHQQTRTLLVLDDESSITAAINRLLRNEGYQVLLANHTDEAFELLARHPVGVILSDQRMPGMNGVEFLSIVKRLYPQTVRLIISAHRDFEAAVAAINHGAVHRFLEKPWDDRALRGCLAEAFEQYERG